MRRILATFYFKKTALHLTHRKLRSIFCALFLKITLSAAKLILEVKRLGAAIWHPAEILCIWGTVKDKCYADKPLNRTDGVGYNIASRGSHLQLYFSIFNRRDCTFKCKRILRRYSTGFYEFSKKKKICGVSCRSSYLTELISSSFVCPFVIC